LCSDGPPCHPGAPGHAARRRLTGLCSEVRKQGQEAAESRPQLLWTAGRTYGLSSYL
jgi:hypothetical protein